MAPHDLKRLIAGFLVFSSIASVATLVSLNFIGSGSPSEQTLQVEGENGNSPLTTVGKNAFVEKLPGNGTMASVQSSGNNATSPSSNLTQNFAGVFAGQMIENNQDGPQLDSNGEPTVLNLPGNDKAAEMIKTALSKTKVAFDDRISAPADKIKKSFAPDDVSAYLKQVNEIFAQVSSSTKTLAGVSKNQNTDSLIFQSLAIESAFTKLSSLSVPQPLAALHTTLLRFFANQKNVFNAVADYQSDPMKTMIALQTEKDIVSRDIALVKKAASSVNQKSLSSNNIPEWERLYSEIFGIQKAHALFGFGDIVFDPSTFGEAVAIVGTLIEDNLARIWEWLYGTALAIAKDVLINEFQNQVVSWIAGNGKPKFITDWSGFLNDVAGKAIGQAVYKILPQACTGLGPLLRVSLLPVPYANTGVTCTLNQISRNINNFMNNFRNGRWYVLSGGGRNYNSWNNFVTVLQPYNNFFGSSIIGQDKVMTDAMNAQKSAASEGQAGGSFLSVKKCVEWNNSSEWGPNCTKEVITTPGNIVGQSAVKALGFKPEEINNAQRFEQLVAAIVNTAINRIITSGLEGLASLTSSPPPTNYSAAPDGTANLPQNHSGNTPGGVANPGSPTGALSSLNNMIISMSQTGVFNDNQAIIDADTQWLNLQPQAISTLNRLSSSCSNLSSDAQQRIGELNSFEAGVRAELANANTIQNARMAAGTATLTQDITDILSVLRGIDVLAIRDISATAQTRAAAIQNVVNVVPSIVSNSCSGSVPSATTPTQSSNSGGNS